MSVPVLDQGPLFTKDYKRCRFPVDNAFSPGDRVMVAVPGGIVFVSRRGIVHPGKRTLMFCNYETSPSIAEDLFGHHLRCGDVISIAFTGSMLVVVAEGSLDHPEDCLQQEEKGVWCFSWTDLYERRITPIHLFSIPRGVVNWGSVAGVCGSCAFVCDGTLTISGSNLSLCRHERFRTKISMGEAPIVAVSAEFPEMIVAAGDRQLAVAPLDSPAKLHDNVAKLPMRPSCLDISHNGQMIAIGYPTGLLELRDSRHLNRPVLSILELRKCCSSVTFNGPACDRLFAAAADSGEIIVVDTRLFTGHQKFWLPAIPRPSETLSRYDLRAALWPSSRDVYELPSSKPENYITALTVSDMVWMETGDGVLAVGTNEGILFIRCGHRILMKSAELM